MEWLDAVPVPATYLGRFLVAEWLGAWVTLPVALSLIWLWLNPRVFPPPEDTGSWASMGTFAERVYLNRAQVPIPEHHRKAARVLHLLATLGVPVLAFGLYTLDVRTVALGNVWVMAFKAWFVDRMVWLYLDMNDRNPEYRQWLILVCRSEPSVEPITDNRNGRGRA